MQIVPYTSDREREWDRFVMEGSVHGTFLQTRRFLGYHPPERFDDCSVMIYGDNGVLWGVCPSCRVVEDGQVVFFSHKGSTFGGLILAPKAYRSVVAEPLLLALEEYLQKAGFTRIVLKQTSDLFATRSGGLLEYLYGLHGYTQYTELNTFVELAQVGADPYRALSQGKRCNVNRCQKAGMTLRPLTDPSQVGMFYRLLCRTLEKYQSKPVHTLEELLELWQDRLSQELLCWGVYAGEEMVAGAVCFVFTQTGCWHLQYAAADHAWETLSPMTYLYYSLIGTAYQHGATRFSFGISTEERGTILNRGLLQSKEAYGSTYCLNRSFAKDLSDTH